MPCQHIATIRLRYGRRTPRRWGIGVQRQTSLQGASSHIAMSKSEGPPAYSSSDAELEPPTYSTGLPATFHVGKHDTPPVIGLDEVEAHLRILGAFGALKARVIAAQKELATNQQLDATDAWTVFLCRAVHRFELWIRSLPAAAITVWKVLPPIDVLLVWHTYLLASRGPWASSPLPNLPNSRILSHTRTMRDASSRLSKCLSEFLSRSMPCMPLITSEARSLCSRLPRYSIPHRSKWTHLKRRVTPLSGSRVHRTILRLRQGVTSI